jgi:hypothetical protein
VGRRGVCGKRIGQLVLQGHPGNLTDDVERSRRQSYLNGKLQF